MRTLYTLIKAQLALLANIKHIAVYNDQLGLVDNRTSVSYPYPAVFIEMVTDIPARSVGNGVQLYEPLDIRIHIVHEQLDSQLGTLDENLDVLDLKDLVYQNLQMFEPNGASTFFRISEVQDYEHSNIYHYIQTYRTTYLDAAMILPVGGVPAALPITAEIELSVDPTSDPDDPYTITLVP